MKTRSNFIYILLFSLFSITSASAASPDTIFLTPNVKGCTPGSKIYISPVSHGWRYDSLRSLNFACSSSSIKSPYPYGTWIELKLYHDRYYVYYPCDLGNIYRLNISRDFFREYRAEQEDYRITSTKKSGKRKYIFEMKTPNQHKKERVLLHIVDEKKGLAVVERIGVTQPFRYTLVVNADNLTKYPMIIYDCPSKSSEYEFTDPDFKRLTKK